MEPGINPRCLTIKETALYLGCTVRAVRELIWDGSLPYLKLGKRFVLDIRDLDRLIDARKVTNALAPGLQQAKPRRLPMRTRGTGGLIKKAGSKYWYALVWQHGRQRTVSLRTESKMVAERALNKLISKVERREALPSDLAKISYEELRDALLQDYKLSGRKSLYEDIHKQLCLTSTKHLDIFFAGYRLPAITSDAINQFKQERQAAGEAAGTTNRALSALKRMFRIAVRDCKIPLGAVPYIGMFKEAPARKGFLEPSQFQELRRQLPERLRAFVTLAYYTGMRSGELKNLQWSAVDMTAGILRLHADETKSGEPRLIPLNPEVLSMLAMLPRDRGPYVFGGRWPLGSFRKAWASACKRAGLPDTLVHDLRRSGVRNLRRAGVAREVAMRISGHKTESVYRRYSIVSEADLKEASTKLDTFLEAQAEARKASHDATSDFDESTMKVDRVQ